MSRVREVPRVRREVPDGPTTRHWSFGVGYSLKQPAPETSLGSLRRPPFGPGYAKPFSTLNRPFLRNPLPCKHDSFQVVLFFPLFSFGRYDRRGEGKGRFADIPALGGLRAARGRTGESGRD